MTPCSAYVPVRMAAAAPCVNRGVIGTGHSVLMTTWPYPRIMVHRCGGGLTPENTLSGLPLTQRLGYEGVEFDVMLSGDGTPVLIHDETLERTTTGTGRVCHSSDAQLASVDAGAWFHRSFAGTRIPFFAETIAECLRYDLMANVEIKPAEGVERETGLKVARMAAEGWMGARVQPLLSSFSPTSLLAAAEVAPHLPRGWLVDRIPGDWQAQCKRLGVIAVHTNCKHLDEKLARAIKAAGYRIAVYTENDPAHGAELVCWGVDTLITDRPDLDWSAARDVVLDGVR